jgi:hypothetical protein
MVGASDIGLTLEGPIGDKGTFLVSSRRSYLQFLFQAIGLPFLPTYNDFQAKIKFKLDEKNELTFIGLGAIDQFKLNLEANETEDQQFILDQLPTSPQWNYTNGLVWKHFTQKGYWTFVLSRNMLDNKAIKYAGNDDSKPENKMSYQFTIDAVARPGDTVYYFMGGQIVENPLVAINVRITDKKHDVSYVVYDEDGERISIAEFQIFTDRKSLMESLFPEFKGRILKEK